MGSSPRRKRRLTYIVGAIGLFGVVALALVVATASTGRLPGMPYTVVRAAFGNSGTLQVGNDVRENSKRIGKVAAVKKEPAGTVVTLTLDTDMPVYGDARAAVWDQSALAKKFVELDRGHEGAGDLGDRVIDARRNANSADLDQLLEVFDPRTRGELTSAVRELGGGLAEHSRDLHDVLQRAPEMLPDLGQVSNSLSSPEARLPDLLSNADKLSASFQGHERQISSLIQKTGSTLDAVATDGGDPLRKTVHDLPSTLQDARSSLASLNPSLRDTAEAMAAARPGAAALGRSVPDLRGVLREGVAPLDRVPGVARVGEPAVDELSRTFADARPLAPRLSRTVQELAPTLQTLGPYANELGVFLERLNSLVSTSVAPDKHGARLGLSVEGPAAATGGLFNDPFLPRNPYPAPGQASNDRAKLPVRPSGGR